jgi:2-dehydro-3-deoxygluconokinase
MVLSFGELLLRICPDTDGEWLERNNLSFYVGGAEANVATALALWGIPSAYCTAVPNNLMTMQILSDLQKKGVDVSRVIHGGQRLGLYFLPKGKDLKNAGVIYDRDHSAFAELKPGMVNWEKVLDGVRWLHFSAISPALNSRVATVCEEALREASARHITISVDLNYRAKLWQYGASPEEVMPGLVKYCDVVMGNLWAAEKMLGVPVDAKEIHEKSEKKDYLRHARVTSEKIMERFPKVNIVANTFRFDKGATGIHYYTTLFSGKELYSSAHYEAEKILDKVGSGDCFMAGLIYGLYRERLLPETLEFATAAAFLKLFIASDATDQKAGEIEKYLKEKV